MSLATLFIVLLAVAGAQAQCSPGPTPNACKYGTNQLNFIGGTIAAQICADVNRNPFNIEAIYGAIGLTADQCTTAARLDGKNCIEFYGEVQCAGGCEKCGFNICPSFCANYASICPTATEAGCFDHISCSGSTTACTKWDVAASALPSPLDGTTTTHTTSSHTTTTTSSHTTTTSDSSAGSIVSVAAGALAVAIASFIM